MLANILTLLREVNVFKCDYLPRFLVPPSVDPSEPALAEQLLLLILVHHLPRVEVLPLVVIVDYVTISQVDHVVVMKEQPLGRIYSAERCPLELQLALDGIDKLINFTDVHARYVETPRGALVKAVHFDVELRERGFKKSEGLLILDLEIPCL